MEMAKINVAGNVQFQEGRRTLDLGLGLKGQRY